jgi:hypothetical protein
MHQFLRNVQQSRQRPRVRVPSSSSHSFRKSQASSVETIEGAKGHALSPQVSVHLVLNAVSPPGELNGSGCGRRVHDDKHD